MDNFVMPLQHYDVYDKPAYKIRFFPSKTYSDIVT